mgnify:CR=1 FL=1
MGIHPERDRQHQTIIIKLTNKAIHFFIGNPPLVGWNRCFQYRLDCLYYKKIETSAEVSICHAVVMRGFIVGEKFCLIEVEQARNGPELQRKKFSTSPGPRAESQNLPQTIGAKWVQVQPQIQSVFSSPAPPASRKPKSPANYRRELQAGSARPAYIRGAKARRSVRKMRTGALTARTFSKVISSQMFWVRSMSSLTCATTGER